MTVKPSTHWLSASLALLLLGFITWNLVDSWPENLGAAGSTASGFQALREKYGKSDLAVHGFSVVQVAADAHTASNGGEFLTMYLEKHFPVPLTDSDLELLHQSVEQLEDLSDEPSNHYKKGVYYFFLALVETMRISTGEATSSPAAVTAFWKKSFEELKNAGELSHPLAGYIQEIILQADRDRNQQLSRQEIESIISDHLYGRAK